MGSPLCHFTFLHLLFLLTTFYSMAINSIFSLQPYCHDDESSTLMQFKQSLSIKKFASRDPSAYSKLALWKREGEGNSTSDCCSWDGVTCNEDTGHVIGLDLSSSYLYGSINSNSSLFHLVHLQRLNLADNDFNNSLISSGFGGLSKLAHLNLSSSAFVGDIPLEISNLTKLASLDLSKNNFSGQIHSLFSNLTQLVHLDLGYNHLMGHIPSAAFMKHLRIFNLESNQLTGQIPYSLMNLTQLRVLDLSYNLLQGSIPEPIFQLVNLEFLVLHTNNLNGTVKLDMFLSLRKLIALQLSNNQLTLFTSSFTINASLPKLKYLELASCNLTKFPDFLKNQQELRSLLLGNNKIQGLMPNWIWNMSIETLLVLDLSQNSLTSDETALVLPWHKLRILDLSFNMLKGSLPSPPLSCFFYSVSNNKLTGHVPPLFCNLSSAFAFDLSYNKLSGVIPWCLSSFTDSLSVLNLRSNNLHGPIPQIYTNGSKLMVIDLGQNQLQGPVPRSLTNCSMLESLDLGNNQINDTFPFWLGTLNKLKVLILCFNKFHGAMLNHPNSCFAFPKLHIIDLSHNRFIGKLPSNYFDAWKAMKSVVNQSTYMEATTVLYTPEYSWEECYDYSMTLENKGVQTKYMHIPNILTAIDLSSNQFEGEIPESVGILKGLHMVNLSDNNLIGHIPSSFGNLTQLESLDLSQNKLSGKIPLPLTQLTFLEIFNVSHNQLTGPIPQGRQFDTFQKSSYEGNSGLCGDTLSKKCGNLEASPPSNFEEDNGHSWFPISKTDWIVICMGYRGGLIVGLIIGHTLTTRYHEWFVSTFGRNQNKQRRKNKSVRRS